MDKRCIFPVTIWNPLDVSVVTKPLFISILLIASLRYNDETTLCQNNLIDAIFQEIFWKKPVA